MLGTIRKIVQDRGFAFINGDDGHQAFLHVSAVIGGPDAFDDLREADRVSYIAESDPKGLRAINCELVERVERIPGTGATA